MRVLLWTGAPGVGKTTAALRLSEMLPPGVGRGFFTQEMRERGKRVGFRIQALDGREAVLAHRKIRSANRVGDYGVDVAALDRIADATLTPPKPGGIYLVDEIGKMECFSARFVEAVTGLLESPVLLVATVAARGGGLIGAVKARAGVELWELTRENRDQVPVRAFEWLRVRALRGPEPSA